MKINREMLTKYANLSDESLWREIRGMAQNYGYALPEKQPTHAEMEKIRSLMRGDTEIGMAEALKILNSYKSRK